MTNPTPDLNCKYGAPMGRGWPHLTPKLAETVVAMYASTPPASDVERRHLQVAQAVLAPGKSPKVALRRVRVCSGGYDQGGAYWGTGKPLYWAGSDCGSVDLYFRAGDRQTAKAHVLQASPAARFYN